MLTRLVITLFALVAPLTAAPLPSSLRSTFAHTAVGGLGLGVGNTVGQIGTMAVANALMGHHRSQQPAPVAAAPASIAPVTVAPVDVTPVCAALQPDTVYFDNGVIEQVLLDGTVHPLSAVSSRPNLKSACPVPLVLGKTYNLGGGRVFTVSSETDHNGFYSVMGA